ncbi:MAG: nuclear transport factor 2 family protein, partial [Desulfobacterales bacterium]|nr:nuclear transport factor 2 family protein [Desulfobacterales bacterium]
MKLSRKEIETLWDSWNKAWDNHDLEGVMEFFHDDIYFNNWTGGNAKGKKQLWDAWHDWFSNHGNFKFTQKEVFIDVEEQKLLFRWELEWPSFEKGYEDKPEIRRGVDVIHFKNGKIINKLTYCKTTIEIQGNRVKLTP